MQDTVEGAKIVEETEWWGGGRQRLEGTGIRGGFK